MRMTNHSHRRPEISSLAEDDGLVVVGKDFALDVLLDGT